MRNVWRILESLREIILKHYMVTERGNIVFELIINIGYALQLKAGMISIRLKLLIIISLLRRKNDGLY